MKSNYKELKKELEKKLPRTKAEKLKADLKKLKKQQEKESLEKIIVSAIKTAIGEKISVDTKISELDLSRETLEAITAIVKFYMPEMPEKLKVDVINQLNPNEIAKEFADQIKSLIQPVKTEKEIVKVVETVKLQNIGIIESELKKLNKATTKAKKDYSKDNPLPVRLSNGKEFYDALATYFTSSVIDSVSKGYLQTTSLNTARISELGAYEISDTDDDAEPNYYGYLKSTGEWYILKEESGTYRYVKGDSGYTTAWTARASQSYDYFDEVFG